MWVSESSFVEIKNYTIWLLLLISIDAVPLCKGFLSRKWYSFEGRDMQGGEYNSLLEQLLKGYFKDSTFSFIRSNLQWVKTEINELDMRGGLLPTFPCVKM